MIGLSSARALLLNLTAVLLIIYLGLWAGLLWKQTEVIAKASESPLKKTSSSSSSSAVDPQPLANGSTVPPTRSPKLAPPQLSESSSSVSLANFFELLCRYNVTKCCRHEFRLDVLDELSLALGAVQTYDQHQVGASAIRLPKKPEHISLNCSRYVYELKKIPKGLNASHFTTTRQIQNEFQNEQPQRRRRRLVFIRPDVKLEMLRPMFRNQSFEDGFSRPIVDVLMVSNELDMLQARMHHLYHVVDYFVIVESSYNHRGWKKHRFVQRELAQEDNRFALFQSKMILVDIDACDDFSQKVQTERQTLGGRGRDVWVLEDGMRQCTWPTIRERLSHLPNTTLLMRSDLDWIPCVHDLYHLKHCEPTPAWGIDSPFRMALKHVFRTSLASRSKPEVRYQNEYFALTPLGRVRREQAWTLRGFGPNRKAGHYDHPIMCGIHLQLMGSLANVLYREVTHIEGSNLDDKLGKILEGRSYCDIDDEFLERQQQRMSSHPEYFHSNFMVASTTFDPHTSSQSSGHPEHKKDQESMAAPIPSEDLIVLREAGVPSVLLERWQSYPFYWGIGRYDMYSGGSVREQKR